MKKVLIDAEVILDFFLNREPFAEYAARILSLCDRSRIIGYVTPVTLSNAYYLLRKLAKHEKVIEKLRELLAIVDVAIIDKAIIMDALKSEFKDFEDALQNFSTRSQNEITIILTRNVKDYKTSELSIMTPESYLKTFVDV